MLVLFSLYFYLSLDKPVQCFSCGSNVWCGVKGSRSLWMNISKGIQWGSSTQNGSSVLSTTQSVMLPEVQLWYLIKAKLHHCWEGESSTGKVLCVHVCFQEAWGRELTECEEANRGAGLRKKPREKEDVLAVPKMGNCRLSHLCVVQHRWLLEMLWKMMWNTHKGKRGKTSHHFGLLHVFSRK